MGMDDAQLVKTVQENPYKVKLITHSRGPPTWEISVSGPDKEKVYAELMELNRKLVSDFGAR